MAIVDMIPTLPDKELAVLKGNADRLASSGTPKQQAQAAELMPSIVAELAARLALKPAKRAPVKRTKAAAAAVEVEEEAEEETEDEDEEEAEPVEG